MIQLFENQESEGAKNLNRFFKVAQIKFLAGHITNQKVFQKFIKVFIYLTVQNIFMEQDLYLIS